jgi:hypothetical protein
MCNGSARKSLIPELIHRFALRLQLQVVDYSQETPEWPDFADDGLGTGCDGAPPAGIVTQSNACPAGTAQNRHKVVAGEQE